MGLNGNAGVFNSLFNAHYCGTVTVPNKNHFEFYCSVVFFYKNRLPNFCQNLRLLDDAIVYKDKMANLSIIIFIFSEKWTEEQTKKTSLTLIAF